MPKKKSPENTLVKVLLYTILILLAASFLYPLLFMVINSVRTQVQYMKNPFGLELSSATLQNYKLIFTNFKIGKYLWNTLLATVMKVALTIPLSIIASYSFAKLAFRGKKIVYPIIMIAMFIPFQVIMIPMYVMLTKMHLLNSFWGLTLVTSTLAIPGSILLMTSSFRGIPNEMLEAATLDGCGFFRIIWNVIVPIGKPTIAISFIMTFIGGWNDLLPPMVIMKDTSTQLIMPALNNLVSLYSKDIPFQLTGLLIASLPAILIYIILQKQIIMGISGGSIK